MTNFETLMSCQNPEHFLRLWREKLKCGCRQKNREDHKKYCLGEYSGADGCKACTINYLNEEYTE